MVGDSTVALTQGLIEDPSKSSIALDGDKQIQRISVIPSAVLD